MNEETTYPYFVPVTMQEWGSLNEQATQIILDLHGPGGGDNYSNCMKDAGGGCWFIVNPEIEELISEELKTKKKEYSEIVWPDNNI